MKDHHRSPIDNSGNDWIALLSLPHTYRLFLSLRLLENNLAKSMKAYLRK